MQIVRSQKTHHAGLLLVMVWLLVTAWAFWWFQLRFLQPSTTLLSELSDIKELIEQLPEPLKANTPHAIHIYDPGCICSRFNEAHARSIIRDYSNRGISFHIAVPDERYLKEAEQTFGVTAFVSPAVTQQLSSPLAVILDASHRPVYLGSYSDRTLCTAEDGQLVENALDALLSNQQPDISQATGGCLCPWPNTSASRS